MQERQQGAVVVQPVHGCPCPPVILLDCAERAAGVATEMTERRTCITAEMLNLFRPLLQGVALGERLRLCRCLVLNALSGFHGGHLQESMRARYRTCLVTTPGTEKCPIPGNAAEPGEADARAQKDITVRSLGVMKPYSYRVAASMTAGSTR